MKRKNLLQLFIPIFFETLFYMLAGIIDTLMVSSVGDQAVGAIGTANTYISVFVIMYAIVSNGMMAVMTQNIGAGREGVAYQARNLGLIFNAAFGILLSSALYFGASLILGSIGVSEQLYDYALTYLRIVGGCSFLNAIIPIMSGYLRAFGHTRQSLFAAITGNVVNLGLNALFLYVMDWGVAGVALATVISRAANLLMVTIFAAILIKAKRDPSREKPLKLFGQIVKVGLPAAMETVAYNLSMTLVIKFLNQMDTAGFYVTARSYTAQIANFSYCVGAALAQANSIMTGWRVGAGEFDAVKRGTRKAALIGIGIAVSMATILCLASPVIMKLFTDDPLMVSTVRTLLFIDIFLEIGRVSNLVYVQTLKVSGDAIFPAVSGIIFMMICQVAGTYLLGIRLGLLVVGAYTALAMDEMVRAVIYFFRFKSGRWMSKRLVDTKPVEG